MNILTLIALPLFHVVIYNSSCTVSQVYEVDEVGIISSEAHILLVKDGKTTEVDVRKEKGVVVTVNEFKWIYEVHVKEKTTSLDDTDSLCDEKDYDNTFRLY